LRRPIVANYGNNPLVQRTTMVVGLSKARKDGSHLSRRYSRHLLEEAGVKLPRWSDALKTYVPIDGGEEKFDPGTMAKIQEFGRCVDAMR
jgi:hypothetical protein